MAVVDNERNLMTVLCNYDDDDAYDKELLPTRHTHKIYTFSRLIKLICDSFLLCLYR